MAPPRRGRTSRAEGAAYHSGPRRDLAKRAARAYVERMQHLVLRVEGMTCGGCVAAVKNVLARQPGVKSSKVTIGSVELDLDESAQSLESIREAIAKAGYSLA